MVDDGTVTDRLTDLVWLRNRQMETETANVTELRPRLRHLKSTASTIQ